MKYVASYKAMDSVPSEMPISSQPYHYLKDKYPDAALPHLRSSLKVRDELRGQSYELEGLDKVFSAWPFAVNEHLDAVRTDIGAWLDR